MEVNQEVIDTAGMTDGTKEARKQFSRIGLYFFIGSVVITVVQFCLSLALGRWKPEWLADTNISLLLSVVSMYLTGMPLIAVLSKKLPAVKIPKRQLSVGKFLLALLMCYPIIYCGNLIGTLLTTVIGVLKGSGVNNQIANVVLDANIFVILLYMVICAPILEELVFRKLIIDRTVRYGQGVAIVVSGVMFGLFHGNLNQFAYAALMGMFLAFLYVKTGNVKITIGIHMVINFFGGVVSTLLLKAINYERLIELSMGGAAPEELMQYYMENLPGWIGYILYVIFILAVVITGIVLLIVYRKRFTLEAGEAAIPKNKRFQTIFLNFGMILFCLFWMGMIIWQLIV